MSLPGYDEWKLRTPEEDAPWLYRASDNPDCSCTLEHRDEWCRVHGRDPDAERDAMLDDEIDREIAADEAAFEEQYAAEHPDDDYLGRP